MRPLTRADMYDRTGKCILPVGGRRKRGSKYIPREEDEKHYKQRIEGTHGR